MNVSKAILEIRNKINDREEVGLEDEELLSYLNEAILYISNYLIGIKSPAMVEELVIDKNTITVPENFAKTVGGFPIKRTGNTIKLLCEPPVTIRYLVSYKPVEMDGEMPFSYEALNNSAIKLACIYANVQERTDVTQDKTLLDEINTAISNAVSS